MGFGLEDDLVRAIIAKCHRKCVTVAEFMLFLLGLRQRCRRTNLKAGVVILKPLEKILRPELKRQKKIIKKKFSNLFVLVAIFAGAVLQIPIRADNPLVHKLHMFTAFIEAF